MKVSICIITCQRPTGLKNLLMGIAQQDFIKVKRPDIEVIVVENDTDSHSQHIIDDMIKEYKLNIIYGKEETKGIPFARNKSIKLADVNTNFIIFIDDDEVPSKVWLEELIIVQQQFGADVVAGPVIPIYCSQTPKWIVKGGFFDRAVYENGQILDVVATNNTLVKREIFKDMNRMFDPRFALTGGSDTHFFMDVHKRGYKMVWANEAKVSEKIPLSRSNIKWLIKRAYRHGNVYSRCEKYIYTGNKIIVVRLIKSILKIVISLLKIIVNVLFNQTQFIKALRSLFLALGEIAGIFEFNYKEYKTIHKV